MLFAEEWAQIFFSSLQKYAKRLTQHKNEALWAADLGIIEKILLCRKSYKDLLCILVLEITENLEIKVFKAVWPWFLGFQVYPAEGGGTFAAGVPWPYRRPQLLENIIKLYIWVPFSRAKQSEEVRL